MVCSRALASARGRRHQRDARLILRARHIERQGMRGGHASALIEQRLDLRINRHGVFRGRPELLRGACHRRRGGQEAVEHLPRAFVEMRIVLAIEHTDAVDEHAVHADRIAQGTRAAPRQIVDPAWG
jgi:hypothetical protein